jgi:hypothetical protein
VSGEADMALARSIASLSTWLESETAKMGSGEPFDATMITRSGNAIRRLRADLAKRKRQ